MDVARVNKLRKQIECASNRVSANMHRVLTTKQLRNDVMAKRITSFVLHIDGTAITVDTTGKHGGVKRLDGLFNAMISDYKDAIANDCASIAWCSEQLAMMLDE